MRIIASIFLLFILGCNSKAQTDKAKSDSIFKLALKADSLNDYKTSILYYNQILDIDSLNIGALVNRGKALIATSNLQEGFTDLNKSIKYYPHERTYYARGVTYMYLKQLDSAKKDFNTAIQMNPLFPDVYYALSNLFLIKKEFFPALYNCELADKYGINKNISNELKTEMTRELGRDIVNNFNYDSIIKTIRNLPKVKKAEEKSLEKNKYGFTYSVKMEKSTNWTYIITVHSKTDIEKWIFNMDAATLKVLTQD